MRTNYIKESSYSMNNYQHRIQQRMADLIDNISLETLNESMKIFITEFQITILMINIIYNEILNINDVNNFSILPYTISNILSLRFIIPDEKHPLYYMSILFMWITLFIMYFLISFYSIITIIYTHSINNNSHLAKYRLKWMKFIISFHIPLNSFYLFTWSTTFIRSLANAKSEEIQSMGIWIIIPFIIINIANAVLCSIILQYTTHLLFNNSMDGKRSNIGFWFILIFRLGVVISQIIPDNSNAKKWYLMSLIITFLMTRTWEIFFFPCYYNLDLIKIFGVFYGIKSGIVWAGIAYAFIDEISTEEKCLQLTCLILLICPIIAKSIINFQEFTYGQNLRIHIKKKLTIDQTLSRFIYFSHNFTDYISGKRKIVNKANIILTGKLILHLNECADCPIKDDINIFLNNPIEKNLELFGKIKIHVLGSILKDIIEVYPKAYKLALLYIELIMNDNTKTFHQPFLLLQKIPKNKLAPYELLAYYILNLRIHKKVMEINENKFINFEPLIVSQALEVDLINKIESQGKNHLKWWKAFKESTHIELDCIVSLARKIDNEFKALENLWKHQEFVYDENLYIRPYLIYSIFLETIKDNSKESASILKKYSQMKTKLNYNDKAENITQANLISEKNVAIKVAIAKNQLGEIIYCSNYISQLLGYTKQEVISKKEIEAIMPQFYQVSHKKFVSNYFNTGRSKVFNRMVNIFTQHKEGYLVPSSLTVSLIPDSTQGTSLIGLIRERKILDDIILVSLDGHIVGFTKTIMNKLNIKGEDLSGMMIWNICPMFKKALSAFQIVIQNSMGNNMKSNESQMKCKKFEENPLLNENDKLINLTLEKAEKLVQQYQNRGDILEYDFQKNKNPLYIVASENYHTIVQIESYLTGTSILKLTIKKLNLRERIKLRYHNKKSQDSLCSIIRDNSPNITSFDNLNNHYEELPALVDYMQTYGLIITASKAIHRMKTPDKSSDNIPTNNPRLEKMEEFYEDKSIKLISKIHFEDSKKLQIIPLKNYEILSSKAMEEPKTNPNDPKSKKLIAKKPKGPKSSYQTKTSLRKENHDKIHKALEISNKPKILRAQLLLIPVLLLASVILMIIVEQKGKEVATEANNYVTVIHSANQRSLNIIELFHRAKMLWMIKKNLFDETNICNNECGDFPLFTNYSYIETIAKFLLGNTTIIAQSIYSFDDALHRMFYNPNVELYDIQSNGKVDTTYITVDQFKAIQTIYDQCIQLTKIPIEKMTENTTQLNYILKNLLDDLGIVLNITDVKIVNQMNNIIITVKELLLDIIIILTPVCLFIWTTIFLNTMHLYNQNRRILLQTIKACHHCFDSQILKITDFMDQLKNEVYRLPNKRKKTTKYQVNSAKSPKEFKSSSLRVRSNQYLLKFTLKIFIILVIMAYIFSSFMIRYIHRGQLNQDRLTALDGITKSNNQIYNQGLSLIYLYEYITSNGSSTAMDQPISTALDLPIHKISSQNDFINSFGFLSQNNDPDIEYLLYGNACTLLPPSLSIIKRCVEIASGPSQRGLIGLNALIFQSISTSKLDFEKSARSENDMKRSLNLDGIKDLELITFNLTPYFYTYLYELLYEKFKTVSESITSSGSLWIWVSSIIATLTFSILWLPIYLKLSSEIDNVKKVLKILPKDCILSYPVVKRYVMSAFGNNHNNIILSFNNQNNYTSKYSYAYSVRSKNQ